MLESGVSITEVDYGLFTDLFVDYFFQSPDLRHGNKHLISPEQTFDSSCQQKQAISMNQLDLC